MPQYDLEYLCTRIARLSSVPARIYRDREKIFLYSPLPLPADPILPAEDRILNQPDAAGYVVTEDFDFYGFVLAGDLRIVLGPCRQVPRTLPELRHLAFGLSLTGQDAETFVSSMAAIITLPLDFLLQILCMIRHIFTGEKLELADLKITDLDRSLPPDIATPESQTAGGITAPRDADPWNRNGPADISNAYRVEQEILALVRRGDLAGLERWAASAPPVLPGQTSSNSLRQEKNMFTVTVTLVSRAAIEGGMDVADALRLSDSFIRKCELLPTLDAVSNLMYSMVRAYTEEVAGIQALGIHSELAARVATYVRHHLSEPIRTADLAGALYMNRSRLSTNFRKEQGITLTDFIWQVKILEAQRLLEHSDWPLSSIASYLGFSSQSHFCRIFRNITGTSPGEYRNRKP